MKFTLKRFAVKETRKDIVLSVSVLLNFKLNFPLF